MAATPLYHLAETTNLASIQMYGLMSTERLAARVGWSTAEREAFLATHRPRDVVLPNGTFIRHQAPMPPALLGPALHAGLTPADWYRIINGHVFFWFDRARMERHRAACGGRPQTLLVFDATEVLRAYGERTFVARFNLGNARRRAVSRGVSSLVPYTRFVRDGWPEAGDGGVHRTRPAEVLIRDIVPTCAPYLIGTCAL